MEDFPIEVKLNGLAPKQDGAGLNMSINLKPYEKGLRSVLAPRFLYQLNSLVWPFPQLFRFNESVYVAEPNTIYVIDGTGLTSIITGVANANYPWSAAVVGDYVTFTNNKVVVVGRVGGTFALETAHKIPPGRSICAVAGQVVIAAPWAYGRWNYDSVIWGRVGDVNFTLGRDNIAALRHAGCGTVLKVLPMQKKTLSGVKFGFLAFGTEGVSSFLADSLPAVYSRLLVSEVGIHSQLAAAGDEKDQFFVSSDKKLYSISDGVVKELGYQKQLQGAGSDIVLSYDNLSKELWVSY